MNDGMSKPEGTLGMKIYRSFNRWESRGPQRASTFLQFPKGAGSRVAIQPYNLDPEIHQLGPGVSGFQTYMQQARTFTERACMPEKRLA